MKTENTVLYVLRLAVTLLLITAVVAAALAGVNTITKPIIDAQNAEKIQQAIEAVLPGGYHSEITEYSDATGLVTKVYQGDNGFAVQVEPMGFDNTITMMVGIDNEGKILGMSVIRHTETKDLGQVAAANTSKGEAFRGQYVGKTGELTVIKSGEAADDEINAITGATVTSKAVTAGINAALACVAELLG